MKREMATSCLATLPVTLCTLGDCPLGLPKGPAFIKLGMRVRLTHQDKVETLGESHQNTKQLLAVEIIAHQGHVMRDQCSSMVSHPTFAAACSPSCVS